MEREHVCFFTALASAGVGITAMALTPILPESDRGLIAGRAVRALTAAALLLGVLALACLI